MRSIVVFLAGIGLILFGKLHEDSDAQYAGCILMALGLVSMGVGWSSEPNKKE